MMWKTNHVFTTVFPGNIPTYRYWPVLFLLQPHSGGLEQRAHDQERHVSSEQNYQLAHWTACQSVERQTTSVAVVQGSLFVSAVSESFEGLLTGWLHAGSLTHPLWLPLSLHAVSSGKIERERSSIWNCLDWGDEMLSVLHLPRNPSWFDRRPLASWHRAYFLCCFS